MFERIKEKLFGFTPYQRWLASELKCIHYCMEKIAMSLEQVKEELAAVKAVATDVRDKNALILTKLEELKEAGAGATPEQIAELVASASEVKDLLQGVEDSQDAALAEPAPAPEGEGSGEASGES